MRPFAFPAGSAEPLHIHRWVAALVAGRAAKYPKCACTLRSGEDCRNPPLRGAKLCHIHLGGKEREAYDRKRERELLLIIAGCPNRGEIGREQARASLECMMRRRLRRAWKHNPLIEGKTIAFSRMSSARSAPTCSTSMVSTLTALWTERAGC